MHRGVGKEEKEEEEKDAEEKGKAPFVEGSNVIPGNLSFSVYAASYFTPGGHDASVHPQPERERVNYARGWFRRRRTRRARKTRLSR